MVSLVSPRTRRKKEDVELLPWIVNGGMIRTKNWLEKVLEEEVDDFDWYRVCPMIGLLLWSNKPTTKVEQLSNIA